MRPSWSSRRQSEVGLDRLPTTVDHGRQLGSSKSVPISKLAGSSLMVILNRRCPSPAWYKNPRVPSGKGCCRNIPSCFSLRYERSCGVSVIPEMRGLMRGFRRHDRSWKSEHWRRVGSSVLMNRRSPYGLLCEAEREVSSEMRGEP